MNDYDPRLETAECRDMRIRNELAKEKRMNLVGWVLCILACIGMYLWMDSRPGKSRPTRHGSGGDYRPYETDNRGNHDVD